MRRLTILLAVFGIAAGWQDVRADCSAEVADAVEKQANTATFRKETNMITENGPAKMTVEVVAPDRMRQVVSLVVDPKPVETVLIGGKAWSNDGKGWKKLGPKETGELLQYLQSARGAVGQEVGEFKCLGIVPVDGRRLRAYQGIDTPRQGSDQGGTRAKNEAVRRIYLDPETGRLARTIYARTGMEDKPIFAESFSYPEELKIEEPTVN